MFRNIITLIGPKRKASLALLLAAISFGTLLEMVSVSTVAAACLSIIGGQTLLPYPVSSGALLTGLIAIYLLKLVYLLLQNRLQARFVCGVRYRTASEIYESTLQRPYAWFAQSSAAEITGLLNADIGRAAQYLEAFLNLTTEILTLIVISGLLAYIDSVMTLFLLIGAGISLLLTRAVIRPLAGRAGREWQAANVQRLKWLNRSIRGIKEIKVDEAEARFAGFYEDAERKTTDCDALRRVLNKASGLAVECVMVVCILAYLLSLYLAGKDMLAYFPSLSALVAAALRLLPTVKRISNSQVNLANMRPSAEAVAQALRSIPHKEAQNPGRQVALSRSIAASGLTFSYEGRPEPVLENAEIEIPAGASVGIVGPSGSGKTTLVDLLLGLLEPQAGRVTADGVDIRECRSSYLRQTAYIPQDIFLLDDTVRSNVTFCGETRGADDAAVWAALEKASLGDFVRSLPQGLDTHVGENGVRLSGGERQRLGIARALYKGSKLIVFDEATSALDPETEAAVIASIQSLRGEKTTVIISHRASAVAGCDRVYRITNRRAERIS